MQNIKTVARCYLCFLNTDDYIDVFSEEGIQLCMKSILLQHYGFIEVNENSKLKSLNK